SITSQIINISYESVKEPIANFYAELSQNKIPDCSNVNFLYAGGHILFTLFLAAVLGAGSNRLVRFLGIDSKYPVLRFANYWAYYFRGELITTNTRAAGRKKWVSSDIDVLTEDGASGNKLYSGFLSDYTISNSTGELESIVITDAHRWSDSKKAMVKIPGDCLIVPYNKVINFNLRYNFRSVVNKAPVWVLRVLNTIAILSFFSIFYVIPHYFYKYIGLLNTIIGVILAILLWILVLALYVFWVS